ncbi:MAG: AraC family transcriptional regulator [Pseudomonadota bacterium]
MLLYRPPKDSRLTPFIEALWTCEARDLSGLERVLPIGRAQLFINLHGDALHHYDAEGSVRQRASGMVVQGPVVAPVVIDRAEQRKLCGVLFSVGGAYACFGVPVSEIGGGLVDLDRLAWREPGRLHQRLLSAPDPEARLDALEAAFLDRRPAAQDWDVIAHEAAALLRAGASVRTVAQQFDTSQQTLITRFRERTGLTPKTFSRIERFQRIVRRTPFAASWADAALDAGFSDQSHMVREFRRFAAITPTAYRPRAESGRNHVAMLA